MKPVPLEGPLPKIVVFDLDYTLWNGWVDTHVDPPLKRRGSDINKIYDRHNQQISFFRDVPEILLTLHHSNVQVWLASRTHAPKAAKQLLTEMLLEGQLRGDGDPMKARDAAKGTVAAISLFDGLEIYPGSKMEHFRSIAKRTGIDCREMLFFDGAFAFLSLFLPSSQRLTTQLLLTLLLCVLFFCTDESRNREVTKLGVTFVLVPNGGTTRTLFESGLEAWRQGLSSRSS
jgi:magnesium-dependent phosphatase 1